MLVNRAVRERLELQLLQLAAVEAAGCFNCGLFVRVFVCVCVCTCASVRVLSFTFLPLFLSLSCARALSLSVYVRVSCSVAAIDHNSTQLTPSQQHSHQKGPTTHAQLGHAGAARRHKPRSHKQSFESCAHEPRSARSQTLIQVMMMMMKIIIMTMIIQILLFSNRSRTRTHSWGWRRN